MRSFLLFAACVCVLGSDAWAQTEPPRKRLSQRLYERFHPPPRASERESPIPPERRAAGRTPAISPPTPSAITGEGPKADASVRRTQVGPGLRMEPSPPEFPQPAAGGGRPLGLEAALYGTLSGNPSLVALRQGNAASAEAVEVARRFPTTLNPTLSTDIRPWTFSPTPKGGLKPAQTFMYFALLQPLELGHQTTHRAAIAEAAYAQQRWTVVQAEILALVQTYRFFQTAAYRREKLRVANNLFDFNDQLVKSLRDRLKAGEPVASEVALAVVERQASRQQVAAARQEYAKALTDLRNQIGTPEAAGAVEPLGEFVLPGFIPTSEDEALIQTALQSRPDIHAARAQVAGAQAAVRLAKADRIPRPVVGPEYERDQTGTHYLGFAFITPLPVLNNGMPLVRQREAECRKAEVALQQTQQRTVAEVKSALAKWNGANELIRETAGLTEELKRQVGDVEELFRVGRSDLAKVFQARGRLIQLENAELDAVWEATQAQADLLTTLGAPALLQALRAQESSAGAPPAGPAPLTAPTPSPLAGPLRRQP